MNPKGVKALVPVPAAVAGRTLLMCRAANGGYLPLEITAGPDGALWFTERIRGKIGRITTTGDFSEFLVPTANSEPFFITAGPDALWFTEWLPNKSSGDKIAPTGDKIGRIKVTPNIDTPSAPMPQSCKPIS